MNIVRILKTISLAFTAVLCLGCNDWLDVKPYDKMAEEQLYSTESGYMQALNGIYVEMNKSSLYGGQLLYQALEIMAHRYQFTSSITESGPLNLMSFDYTTDYSKNIAKGVWQDAYALIANVNKLLMNAEQNKELFAGKHYDWITGEAYALRAFLHFDLLRLFGPVYSLHKEESAICYNNRFSLTASDILSAEKVLELVLIDLKEAEKRLETDPIIEKGPMLTEAATDAENYWRFRTIRLNYYAVKALQARVYLYAGMNEEACKAARCVTNVQEKWFPFVKMTDIVGNSKRPDRIFSTELLFCLQNSDRGDIFDNNFSPELLESQMLKIPQSYLDRVFGALAEKDWRYEPIWLEPSNYDFRCFHKYEKTEIPGVVNSLIPMLRLSEMYYILAEASLDETEALNSINLVLENRGMNKLTSKEDIPATLLSEYQKEFFGEGQLFYYYKRTNATSIPTALSTTDYVMKDVNYQMPLPEIETDFR